MDVEALHREAKDRYWKAKELSGARQLLERGIAAAREQGSPDLEKPLQFDLASFCWPGWDESGILIAEDDLSAGERAADENLRLATKLDRGAGPLASAHFMVGGYHLVRQRYGDAAESFARQREQAALAGNSAGEALAEGYAALAAELGGKGGSVETSVERLRSSGWEHGADFATQLQTAARVFRP